MLANSYRMLLFPALLLLAACKTAPVYNIQESAFTAAPQVRMSQIEKAIIEGCRMAGWRAKPIKPGKILASYSTRRNKYQALVDIDYDRDSYNISYRSSKNLKYKASSQSAEGTDNFLSEYIIHSALQTMNPTTSRQRQSIKFITNGSII